MNRLENKTVIITGGAGGIGTDVGRLFATDVTSESNNQAIINTAVQRYGGLDCLIANAGTEGDVTLITEYDEKRFDHVLAVNVKGPFLGMKAAIPELEKRGGGSNIITSRVTGLKGAPMFSAYSASKHATIGLMKSAAKECAEKKTRVNTVNPSQVETNMMRRIEEGVAPGSGEEIHEQMKSTIPLGRYAEANDVTRSMLFLASDDSEFITGSVHTVDVGLSALTVD